MALSDLGIQPKGMRVVIPGECFGFDHIAAESDHERQYGRII